jgi:glucose-6-phosphate isomerase
MIESICTTLQRRMTLSKEQLWQRFQKYYREYPEIELALDISRMNFSEGFLAQMEPRMQQAFVAMEKLEHGAIANGDEGRMVGHYWLRNPPLAPTPEIKQEIEKTLMAIKSFAADVHSGLVAGSGGLFKNLLLIGIGGSALGPQLVTHALSHPQTGKLKTFFLDNTDPDGIDRVLSRLEGELGQTICLVISKSGGTKETRNGMLEVKAVYEAANLDFGRHAVAITRADSELDALAVQGKWSARFPMWDWVGGRTSVMSSVGLLPSALQGFEIASFLHGAKLCDEITRRRETSFNPAALLALMWYWAGGGQGSKDMAVIPYKDRLELLSRYLQQLVMESLGKEFDRSGRRVNQGMNVFGNKGSTDQHSYIQQLVDGIDNFFAIFVEVLFDRDGGSIEVERFVTTGDFLTGFLIGTRQALHKSGRQCVTLTVKQVSAFTLGVLIALFERSVGLYAELVNINAYHQPGVEAGKKSALSAVALQVKILDFLAKQPKRPANADQIAEGIGSPAEAEIVFRICEHLSANPSRRIQRCGRVPIGQVTYEFI